MALISWYAPWPPAREHGFNTWVSGVDLRKAYDSLGSSSRPTLDSPRARTWASLKRCLMAFWSELWRWWTTLLSPRLLSKAERSFEDLLRAEGQSPAAALLCKAERRVEGPGQPQHRLTKNPPAV